MWVWLLLPSTQGHSDASFARVIFLVLSAFLFFLSLFLSGLIYLCVAMCFCPLVRKCTKGYAVPVEDRRGSHIPWNWQVVEPLRGCWELNTSPLEEQYILLTSEPSLQLHTWLLVLPAYSSCSSSLFAMLFEG